MKEMKGRENTWSWSEYTKEDACDLVESREVENHHLTRQQSFIRVEFGEFRTHTEGSLRFFAGLVMACERGGG